MQLLGAIAPHASRHEDAGVDEIDLTGLVGGFPCGGIVMWHGTLANIPTGWVLCDGTNSTPDLRNKFVRGAASAADPGATGGADTHTLSVTEIPAHVHATAFSSAGAGVECTTGVDGEDVTGNAVGSTGGGAAHNNLPAYYAIAYIMRT